MKTSITTSSLVNKQELEKRVKEMYRSVALFPLQDYHFLMGKSLAATLGYPVKVINQLPQPAIDSFAGVGYHFDFAQLKPGETVVDLGSGSGTDCFYAAQQVGTTGEVIGIDMTTAQLQKATALKNTEYQNIHFIKGYIEHPPIRSKSVDVVISNGVINLSSDKNQVFVEAARVLKPGGRIALSDIVTMHPLPDHIKSSAELWAACIGGTVQQKEYFELMKTAGFKIIEWKENPYQFKSNGALRASSKYQIKSISLLGVKC